MDDNKPLIDPGIFGGAVLTPQQQVETSNDGGIPDFLRRDNNEVAHAVGQHQVHEVAGGVDDGEPSAEATDAVEGDGPVHDTAGPGDPAGHQGGGGEGALISNAPSEVEKAAHSPVPEHTPIGHNEPPEEPMDREEMIREFNKDIAAYGRDSGKGAAALPRLGLRVIRAAADGLISTDKPKDGSESDAVRIYKRYAEQDSKHAEHTKGGMKANAAKLNALIGLGSMTTVDGVDIADRTVRLRDEMEEADQKPKPLFAGLVDVARAQMDSDTPLTDDAIKTALTKTVKDKTLEKEWDAIHKKIEKLVSGDGELKDQSETAIKIEEMVREHVSQFSVNDKREDDIAFCMERGMTRAEAVAFVDKRS